MDELKRVPPAEREGVSPGASARTRSDAELLERAHSDAAAFAELYRRHVSAISRWFSARAPTEDASELTAETFAQAAVSTKRFRDEADGSAAPWLFGIARNLLRRYYAKRRVDATARRKLGMPVRSYDLDVDELLDRDETARLAPAIANAVDALPAGQREALRLHVIEEHPYPETAAILGVSELAVRIRVSRALATLSRLLRES